MRISDYWWREKKRGVKKERNTKDERKRRKSD